MRHGAKRYLHDIAQADGHPMIADITSHRDQLRELCRQFHVRRLDLFGSATGEDFDAERSDLDFLVEFDLRAPEALSLKTFFGLKESLEKLFGRSVDLVEPGAIRNPYFKASIERSKVPLCAQGRDIS
jgi:predicted nucleotidyltransferase